MSPYPIWIDAHDLAGDIRFNTFHLFVVQMFLAVTGRVGL